MTREPGTPAGAEAEGLLATGHEALAAGRWTDARDAFRAALELRELPEALAGLGEALWWLGEVRESVEARERAYTELRRRPEPARAVDLALGLCIHYRANLGNTAASAGWLARAERLTEESGLEEMRGWVALAKSGQADDPGEAERLAEEARELARRFADLDLELCALAQLGSAVVAQGRLDDGLGLLDEAMAGSLGGEGGSLDTVVFTSCNMIGACSRCAEFERAVQWVRAADRFTERYGCPFLYVYCRTLYGRVLLATGDWDAAERELSVALREAGDSNVAVRAFALATLAELRLAQGRLEEAERLIAGFDGQGPAAPVLASLQLARGETALAVATARRALDAAGGDRLERALLLELLGEAELAAGDQEAAAGRARELLESGSDSACETILARGERLAGRTLAAGGDEAGAGRHLESALADFTRLGMPLEVARTRLLLAEALAETEPEVAAGEARAALAGCEDLQAGRDADAAAALLRRLGVKAARAGPKGLGALTKREREVLLLLGEGLSNPEIAERLYLSRKTVEHHVAHVLSKLDVRNRAEAAAVAVRERESAAK